MRTVFTPSTNAQKERRAQDSTEVRTRRLRPAPFVSHACFARHAAAGSVDWHSIVRVEGADNEFGGRRTGAR